MGVDADPFILLAGNQTYLGMGLHVQFGEDNSYAAFLKDLRDFDVVMLVKPSFQFDKHRDQFPFIRCIQQCADDLAVIADTVQRNLDADHIGIIGCILQEPHKGPLVGFVRVEEEPVFLLDIIKDAPHRRYRHNWLILSTPIFNPKDLARQRLQILHMDILSGQNQSLVGDREDLLQDRDSILATDLQACDPCLIPFLHRSLNHREGIRVEIHVHVHFGRTGD